MMNQDRLRQLDQEEVKNELVKQFTKHIEEETLEVDSTVIKVKVVVVGPTGAGKTSWVTQLIQGKFVEAQLPTVGAKFSSQGVAIDDVVYNFEIWDISGEEWCKSLVPMYMQYAQACVICYDSSSTASFEDAKAWVDLIRGMHTEEASVKPIICMVGMKYDLSEIAPLPVQADLAETFFHQEKLEKDFLFPEVSAKSGENVQDVILTLAEAFHERGIKAPRASVLDQTNPYAFAANDNKKTLGRGRADPYAGDSFMDKFKSQMTSCAAFLRVYTSSCFDKSKETSKQVAEKTNQKGKEVATSLKRQSQRFGGKMQHLSVKLKRARLINRSNSNVEQMEHDQSNQIIQSQPSKEPTMVPLKD